MPKRKDKTEDQNYSPEKAKRKTKSQPVNKQQSYESKETSKQKRKVYKKSQSRKQTNRNYENSHKAQERRQSYAKSQERKEARESYEKTEKGSEKRSEYEKGDQRKELQKARPSRNQYFKNIRSSQKGSLYLKGYYDEEFQYPECHTTGQMTIKCFVCTAIYFKQQLKSRMPWCCKEGTIKREQTQEFPKQIIDIMINKDNPLFERFKQFSRALNYSLSFASQGAYKIKNSNRIFNAGKYGNAQGKGPYVFHCQGQICHTMSTLQPPKKNNINDDEGETFEYNAKYSQIFMLDPKDATEQREYNVRQNKQYNEEILKIFETFINERCKYVEYFKQIKQIVQTRKEEEINYLSIVFKKDKDLKGKIHCQPESDNLAAIYDPTELEQSELQVQKDLIVFYKAPKGRRRFQNIRIDNQNNLPLSYTILFPFGFGGWYPNMIKEDKIVKPKKGKINKQKEAQEMLEEQNFDFEPIIEEQQGPENEEQNKEPKQENKETKKNKRVSIKEFFSSHLAITQKFNPVIHGGRLFQQILVDMQIQIEMNLINYLKLQRGNKKKITNEMIQNKKESKNNENQTEQDEKKTVILPKSFVGSPRYYKDLYRDSMGLVARMGKPDLFITITCNPSWPDITNNLGGTTWNNRPDIVARVFNVKLNQIIEDINKNEIFGKVTYYFYTIQFQKRGLPHCHLLVSLDQKDKPGCKKEIIDKLTKATVTDIDEQKLKEKVERHMIHKSCKNYKKGQEREEPTCFIDGKCKRKFPKQLSEETTSLQSGFPFYKRNTEEDRYVIPYNPYLLMKYDCHINLEVCSGLKVVKYLYKYVTKGMTMVEVGFKNDKDEIETYQSAKYLCAAQAAWRIIGNHLHDRSHAITKLPIHTSSEKYTFVNEKMTEEEISKLKIPKTKLEDFFLLNERDENANQYLYEQIPTYYAWNQKEKKWKPRQRNRQTVSRVSFVSIKRQEAFCLRLLLKEVRGPKSYEDVRTINEITYGTFLQAAIQKGLFITNDEWRKSMKEICLIETNCDIILQTFCYILTFTEIINGKDLWDEFKEDMIKDFLFDNCSKQNAENRALLRIKQILQGIGKTLKECNLPEIDDQKLLSEQKELENEEEERKMKQLIEDYENKVETLNEKQRIILNAVESSLENDQENKLFFIDGAAGTGKTYLYRVIAGMVAKRGKKCIQSATTGIAATLLNGASTVHKCFNIPFGYKHGTNIFVDNSTQNANKLKNCPIFIIDECSSLSKDILQYINAQLKVLMKNDKLFGGKIIILGGDFQQTLPVIEKGSKYETINNCIKKSYLWKQFRTYKLTKNQRCSPGEEQHKEWTKKIGEGDQNVMEVPKEYISHNVIKEIYGDMNDFQPDDVILAPTNKIVNEINQEVLKKLKQQLHTFKNETIAGTKSGEEKVDEDLFPQDFLNSIDLPAMPPYQLKLKIGAIVMLMMNVDVSKGLCNGTRMKIIQILPHSLKCQIISGYNKGQTTWIPKFKMTRSSEDLPFNITRVTFPVKLCFAMTINKSQGQTFGKVGLFLIDSVFAHGQLYVACTRVRKGCNLRIQLHPTQKPMKQTRYFMENVVYKEIFGEMEGEKDDGQTKITDYYTLIKSSTSNKTKVILIDSSSSKKRRISKKYDPVPEQKQVQILPDIPIYQGVLPMGLQNQRAYANLGKSNFCYLNCVIQATLSMEIDQIIKEDPFQVNNELIFLHTCAKLRIPLRLSQLECVELWNYMFQLLVQKYPDRTSNIRTHSSVFDHNSYDDWIDEILPGQFDQLFMDLMDRLNLQHIYHLISIQTIFCDGQQLTPCAVNSDEISSLGLSNPGSPQTLQQAIKNAYHEKEPIHFRCQCEQQHFKRDIIEIPIRSRHFRIRIMPLTGTLYANLEFPIFTTTTEILGDIFEGQQRRLHLLCVIIKDGGVGGGHYKGIFRRDEVFYQINDLLVTKEVFQDNEMKKRYVEELIYELL